jgi:hypothetical protein
MSWQLPYLLGADSTAGLPQGSLMTRRDHDRLCDWVYELRAQREAKRLESPVVRLWDGDYTLRGVVEGDRKLEFEFIENDVGVATIVLSLSHYMAKWVMLYKGRAKRNVHVTIDKQGARWSGRMEYYTVTKDKYGDMYLEIVFLHDMEQLRHVVVWSNPFLRPEVQFPKLWVIFGPAKWCLLLTLFVNLFRLETSLWTLPDNPLDPMEWMGPSFIPTTWRNIVKPFPFLLDGSPTVVVFSRFKTFFDMAKKTLDESQLTMTCRRYLKNEDPHPFADLKGLFGLPLIRDLFQQLPLRNGCLVWDIIDNGGYDQQTAFGGNMLTGFVRAIRNIASDGTTEGIQVFTGSPTFPGEYWEPGFMGTKPSAPHVVLYESPITGIKSTEFKYVEAKSTSYVTGGESMPGINEAISAGVNAGGDFVTSLINSQLAAGGAFGTAIDLPPLGGIFDAIAKLLYHNTFMAFQEVPTLRAMALPAAISGLEQFATSLGDFHLFEKWVDGADRAFTLSALLAVRVEMWKERQHTEHTVEISDAAPYYVGEAPYGHYWLGNRVGVNVFGYPVEDTVFVERVTRLKWTRDEDGPKGWEIELGHDEQKDPLMAAFAKIREVNEIASQIGIW